MTMECRMRLHQIGNFVVKSLSGLAVAGAVLSVMPGSSVAQTLMPPGARQSVAPALSATDKWTLPKGDQINLGTVTVITAPAGGAMSIFGSDMARVLDDGDNLRVLTVLGKGPVQNVIDVLYLHSIDMGLVVSDVPEFYKLQYQVPDVARRLRYIAKLYNNEIHLVAPTSIRTIYDLAGKKIMAPRDVSFYAAKVIFSRLNISATFDYQTDDTLAIQKLIDGEADAYITSTGKPFPHARDLLTNENGKLHFVPIPYDGKLQDLYLPTKFTNDDYPKLIAPRETVDTLAASVLLVSYNWPENTERYNRVARFVDSFFSKIDQFYKPPRHPKWQESSINIDVPGWTRFKAAQDWLDQHHSGSAAAGSAIDPTVTSSSDFQQFLTATGLARRNNISRAEMVKLYDQFLEWNRTRR